MLFKMLTPISLFLRVVLRVHDNMYGRSVYVDLDELMNCTGPVESRKSASSMLLHRPEIAP